MTSLFPDQRPPPDQRCFHSAAVERHIETIAAIIADPELAQLFRNCFPNTLDTTVQLGDDSTDSFVITGDIAAMWLRDSTAQVWPYLAFAGRDAPLRALIAGVLHRQMRCIMLDPYANAFYREATLGVWQDDRTNMVPGVHERKWEIDSLAYFLRLSGGYFEATGDVELFDAQWVAVVQSILATLRNEQIGPNEGSASTYAFRRLCDFGDSLPNEGKGDPSRRCGLVRSAFRPSDDQCKLPFLIPSNAMLVPALRDAARIAELIGATALVADLEALAGEIEQAVAQHGVIDHPDFGPIWAYEIDGFGGVYLMDDANVPSLLSLPYLGFCGPDDPLYQRTRAFCLSAANPYFANGAAGVGIGSMHTGLGTIWPIAIIMQAMTAANDEEITQCLNTLVASNAGTGFIHESFDPDDASHFTRAWFAWANTLFGELISKLHRERPHLLKIIFSRPV